MKLATTHQKTKLIKTVPILIQAATKLVRVNFISFLVVPIKRKYPSWGRHNTYYRGLHRESTFSSNNSSSHVPEFVSHDQRAAVRGEHSHDTDWLGQWRRWPKKLEHRKKKGRKEEKEKHNNTKSPKNMMMIIWAQRCASKRAPSPNSWVGSLLK